MKILHWYVFKELVRIFLLSLVVCTAIFVLVGVIQEASHQGLSPIETLAIIPYVVPTWLPFSIPATLLLSVTFVYGRLAADNEILATKAAGISVWHIVTPALVLGVVLSFVTLYLHDRVIPVANRNLRDAVVGNIEDVIYATLRKDRMFKRGGLPYEIYVERVDGHKLINAVFKRKSDEGGYDQIVFARETQLEFDFDTREILVHMKNVEVTDRSGARIEAPNEKVFPVTLTESMSVKPTIREMTFRDLALRKQELARNHGQLCGIWAFGAIETMSRGGFGDIEWPAMDRLAFQARGSQRDVWRLELEPHLRRAVAFGCLFFVLLGCPVAMLFQRGDYLSTFFSCFVPIMVLYYPMVMFGVNLSKEGIVTPLVVWSGNLMLLVLSLFAFRPVIRH